MIEIQQVSKIYGSDDRAHQALRDVSLTIEDGDIFGIIGQSGAGKSSLVRTLNLLERPTSGKIIVDGQDVTNYKHRDLRELRQRIGMIFQNFSLFQQRTVLKNVLFPLELVHADKAQAEERAFELLKRVGLEYKAHAYPAELSGGQKQRVAIARALINKPHFLLCDEATSALDARTTAQILELLKEINQELGVTLVVITHSIAVAQKICNKIAVIDAGEVCETGPTSEVLSNPQSQVLKNLLSDSSYELDFDAQGGVAC